MLINYYSIFANDQKETKTVDPSIIDKAVSLILDLLYVEVESSYGSIYEQKWLWKTLIN